MRSKFLLLNHVFCVMNTNLKLTEMPSPILMCCAQELAMFLILVENKLYIASYITILLCGYPVVSFIMLFLDLYKPLVYIVLVFCV